MTFYLGHVVTLIIVVSDGCQPLQKDGLESFFLRCDFERILCNATHSLRNCQLLGYKYLAADYIITWITGLDLRYDFGQTLTFLNLK